MNKTTIGKKKGGIEDLAENIVIALFKLLQITLKGLRNKKVKSAYFWSTYTCAMSILFYLTYDNFFTKLFLSGGNDSNILLKWFFSLEVLTQYFALSISITLVTFVLLGIGHARQFKKYQLAIERAGLKSGNGEVPKVKDVIKKDEYRKKVLVETFGVGLNKFEAQKDSLTTGLAENIEKINLAKNKALLEIHLCAEDIPEFIDFKKLYKYVKAPYSFIVGKAMEGPIVKDIRSLPHMLISGTTGGGKSFFFRSTMVSLLKSSPHLQLYLLDLKRGVEVKEFSVLPNVKTIKTTEDSIKYLGAIVDEMNKRFIYLEKKSYKRIEPGRDNFDLIVVGIDEASALFGKKENVLATEYISELAKLARAAAIHIIPATQKPISKAIDTETLDNLPGRMTFKMISTPASNAATGGNHAKNLPDTKGRAVWVSGSHIVHVQAPHISDEDAVIEIDQIKSEFESGDRKNLQELIQVKDINLSKNANEFIDNEKEK